MPITKPWKYSLVCFFWLGQKTMSAKDTHQGCQVEPSSSCLARSWFWPLSWPPTHLQFEWCVHLSEGQQNWRNGLHSDVCTAFLEVLESVYQPSEDFTNIGLELIWNDQCSMQTYSVRCKRGYSTIYEYSTHTLQSIQYAPWLDELFDAAGKRWLCAIIEYHLRKPFLCCTVDSTEHPIVGMPLASVVFGFLLQACLVYFDDMPVASNLRTVHTTH